MNIKPSCFIISIITLFIAFNFTEVKAEETEYYLSNSNITATYDSDTCYLIMTGEGIDVSILNNDEFASTINTIGRENILSIELNNFSYSDGVMPVFYVPNCTSIIFNNIDTSRVTSMSGLFNYCSSLISLDLSSFDTSNVKYLDSTFRNCTSLTEIKGLENWNTDNNYSLFFTFCGCNSLVNLSGISSWNTDNVITMDSVFSECNSITSLDLSNWNTDNVTNLAHAFYKCLVLEEIKGLDDWNTSKVETLYSTFDECKSLKYIEVSKWDVSNVESMYQTFRCCESLNIIDLSGWVPKSLINMRAMFTNCVNITNIIGMNDWDVSKCESLYYEFCGCSNLQELDLSNWNVSNVENMTGLFSGCSSIISVGDLSNWDTSSVTEFTYAFTNCRVLNFTNNFIENWDTSSCKGFYGMFSNCYTLTELDLSNWIMTNATNIGYMFINCSSLEQVVLSDWDVSNCENFMGTFQDCRVLSDIDISKWNMSSATNISGMFSVCKSLVELDVTNWDVSNVTSINGIFKQCSKLTSVGDISNWNTSNFDNCSQMFMYCSKINNIGDLSNWDLSNATNIHGMFNYCSELTFVGDLSNWDISNVQYINQLFANCSKLNNVGNLSNWNLSKALYVNEMFCNCYLLTSVGDLSNWNVSNATYIGAMFNGCKSLTELDLSNWILPNKSVDINNMFNGCSSLKSLDISNWDMSNITSATRAFNNCNSLDSVNCPMNCSITIDLPYEFYDVLNFELHNNINTTPDSTWIYKNNEHTIYYPGIDESYINNYNLPTTYFEVDGFTLNAIGKILDEDYNPYSYFIWNEVVGVDNSEVSFLIDDLGNMIIQKGNRVDVNISFTNYLYQLLYLKDTMDSSYNKEIYYIPELPFKNEFQTELLPSLSKEGYDFVGWSISSEVFDDSTKITDSTSFNKSIIYAHWNAISYTITIYDKDGLHEFYCRYNNPVWSVIDEYLVTYVEPEGYNLASWNTEEDGSGIHIDTTVLCNGNMSIYPIYFSDFIIKIPQVLVANKDGNCSFIISSTLDIGIIELTFPETIYYEQEGKDYVEAIFQYETNQITADNNEVLFNIVCDGLSAGSWECSFNINIDYKVKDTL